MVSPAAPRDRRRWWIIGTCLVLCAAAVLTVVLVLTRSSGSAAASPTSTAQRWIDAHLHHDAAQFDVLSCSGASAKAALFDMTVGAAVRSVTAQPAHQQAAGRWSVELAVRGVQGPAGSFPVTVRRVGQKYLVC